MSTDRQQQRTGGKWLTNSVFVSSGKNPKIKLHFLLLLLALLAGTGPAAARNLTLAWSPSSSSTVAGYKVYYGTASGTYTSASLVGNQTSTTISNLTPGVTYYFNATAIDANTIESGFSGEVSYLVPGTLNLSSGVNPGDPKSIQFPVAPGHWYAVQATTDFKSWSNIWQTSVASTNAWVQFTDSSAGSYKTRYYRVAEY